MANATSNQIDIVITGADVIIINNGFSTISTTLNPYTKSLTEAQREKLFSIAEENEAFVNDAFAQGTLLAADMGATMQMMITNMANDNDIAAQMDTIEKTQVLPMLLRVRDTKRLANHERYTAALAIYKFIEAGAALGLPGYQAAYDILKVRFAAQGGGPVAPTI